MLGQVAGAIERLLPGRKRVGVVADSKSPSPTYNLLKRAANVFSGCDGIEFDVLSKQLTTIEFRALYLRFGGLLVTGCYRNRRGLFLIRRLPTFCVDPLKDPLAMWKWHEMIAALSPFTSKRLYQSKAKFERLVRQLLSYELSNCYIFGTGPSLEKAVDLNFDDGYRIVCNTICKDRDWFVNIKPHILVAGDAQHHFSDTSHAQAFLRDVEQRMEEAEFAFCYPALFDAFVRKRLRRFDDRLIPIPTGRPFDLTVDMTQEFALPETGNVLGLLLLPIACQLAKHVWMLGFDGRQVSDRLFWTSSAKHSYPALLDEMTLEYPAFYEHFMPKDKPGSYVASVHGDALDEAMTGAEKKGWRFTLLSPSTSPALARREVVQRN